MMITKVDSKKSDYTKANLKSDKDSLDDLKSENSAILNLKILN